MTLSEELHVKQLRSSLGYWQQYEIPDESAAQTEEQKIWRDFLIDRRLAYNAVCGEGVITPAEPA